MYLGKRYRQRTDAEPVLSHFLKVTLAESRPGRAILW